MSVSIQTGNVVKIQSGNRVLISAPGPQGPAGSGGGVTDGDKGDITVSSSGSVWTIDNEAVTLGKIQHIATAKLLGRHSTGSGNVQEIGVDGGLQFQGGNLKVDGPSIAGITAAQVGALANGDTGASLTFAEFGLAIFDSATDHALLFQLNEDLTTDKTLTLYVNDEDRQIDIRGDLTVAATATISGTNTGDITLTGAPNYIFLSGQTLTRSLINLGSHVTGTLPVANGGTGTNTLTANAVLLGNGTSALQAVAPSTSGNVLTSNGTTWTSAAPASPLNAAMARYQVHPAQWQINWDANTLAVTSGSGNAANVFSRLVMLLTGTTSGSRAQREGAGVGSNDILMGGPSQGVQIIDFSRQVTIGFAFVMVSSAGATSDVYFRLGTSATNSGTLADRGIGIRVANLTMTGIVHNGTTLNTSATLKTVTAAQLTWVVIQSDGTGNVAFYIDGSLAATLTGGPTTGAAVSTFAAEALNGATAAQTRLHLNQPRIRVD